MSPSCKEFFVQNKNLNTSDWTNAELVSSLPNEDSHYANLVIDQNNTLHLVYSDDRPDLAPYGQKIIYKKKVQGGTWTNDLIVCEFDGTTVNNHFPEIAVANNADVHIVFRHTVIGEPEYISHSFYNAQTDSWSQENISETNTIALRPYPVVSCTNDSRPIAAWEDDEADGGNPNAYFSYFEGNSWATQILLGRDDDKKSHSVKITSLANQTSIVCFAEVSEDGNYDELFYQIFDESNNTLSEKKQIPTINITQNTYLFNYDIVKSTTENMAVLAYSVRDTIYSLHYDIFNDVFTETSNYIETNGGAYILQKQLDITCDKYGIFHIPFSQNNTSGLFYASYSTSDGFSSIENINNYSNIDKPSIVCDNNNKLHMAFCDIRNDTNGDNYVDREIFYSTLDVSTQISKVKLEKIDFKIYPNPAKDKIQLTIYNEQLDIEYVKIFNMQGQLVSNLPLTKPGSQQLDVSNLEKGIYIVKLANRTRKLIKK